MSPAGHPRTLAGRYELGEVTGRGGMSIVYRARDLALDRVVAVKVAHDPQAEENPVYVARFKREARAAAALSHPGAVTVFDAGADGPTRYIVMEYVEGRSLSEVLREQGPLEPARAALIAEQIADALAAAHAAGIVHRDIKPGNVMVGADDRVKVLDFGIARTEDAVTLTQTAAVLGTAPYMAPEQAMGQPADARSDIYSLGCVLYEMLTRQPPFMADVPAAVMHQHVRVPATAPSVNNPAVPPALDALVLEMLAKAPRDRPQTTAEVRDRLAAYDTEPQTEPTKPLAPALEALAGAAAAAAEVPQVATVSQPATVPPEATAATAVLPPPARGPHRVLWVGLAAIAVLLLGAAVALALTGGGSKSASSSTPPHSAATTAGTATHGASTASSTPSSSTSSTPTTATTTVTTTATTTPTGPVPPGQGGAPPGHTKKDKKK